jgi:hypothetical protein
MLLECDEDLRVTFAPEDTRDVTDDWRAGIVSAEEEEKPVDHAVRGRSSTPEDAAQLAVSAPRTAVTAEGTPRILFLSSMA